MLKVENVSYKVSKSFALKDISFELQSGYFMCILGKNGSGKSTLFKLIYGMIKGDTGSITWCGSDVYNKSFLVRQEMAYIGDECLFCEAGSVGSQVDFFSKLYPKFSMKKWKDYLEEFQIDNIDLEKNIKEFSTGQRIKIQLAFSLARSPRLLLLDEATVNFDPVFRMSFMEMLQGLIAKEEISIIMSTHVLEDIEDIADYVIVMKDGRGTLLGGENDGGYREFIKNH